MSIRKLASETAIYGLSSILGRGLYFLLTPLYTGIFTEFEYGIQSFVFSGVGVLMVLATLRLDVAYFRFHGEVASGTLLSTAWLSNAAVGGLLGGLLLLLSPKLALWAGFPAYQWLFALAGGILMFDAITELPLAKLRLEQRPVRFAVVRLGGICVNLALNLFWLYLLPQWSEAPTWFAASASGITYIFLANLIASAFTFLLCLPELKDLRWQVDTKLLKRLLKFSSPLVIVGLSYIINELIDRQLLPYVWPGGRLEGFELAGVYSANYKLAMLLALFTQAFRYGAEPFFFRESQAVDAVHKYARLAKYYLVAALVGFLAVSLFLPLFSQLFLHDEVYRRGSDVVPILLLANVMLGLYYNFSVWYKVTDATRVGAYISVGGAVLTITLNLLLIPIYGFYGCAVATLACYSSMCVAAWWLGRSRYPVPYQLGRMASYTIFAILAVVAYWQLSPKLGPSVMQLTIDGGAWREWVLISGLGAVLFALVVGVMALVEWRSMRGQHLSP